MQDRYNGLIAVTKEYIDLILCTVFKCVMSIMYVLRCVFPVFARATDQNELFAKTGALIFVFF